MGTCYLSASNLNTTVHYQEGRLDAAVWKLNDRGEFTCSSAWETIRPKKPKNRFNTCIWHKNIPFKISFLLRRALREKLPTNDKITSFGVEPSTCSCCISPGLDDIQHVFVTGHFANHVWKYFSAFWN